MPNSLKKFRKDLLSVNIQGATQVARATLRALSNYIKSQKMPTSKASWKSLVDIQEDLANLRPTEPLARNINRWFIYELKKRAVVLNKSSWNKGVEQLVLKLEKYLNRAESKLSKMGVSALASKRNIFTHCHSSSAEKILIAAHRDGKRFKVYHTETRPLFQGYITNKHLRRSKIPCVMVADSAAAWLVSDHSGDDVKINLVLLGADSIARDGSVLNKIGSFGIALAAYDSKIPVYIASTLLKADMKGESKIELRPRQELWPHAPRGTKIINYAFDRVPAKYIAGIICEFGIIKPKQVVKLVKHHYPWLIYNAKLKNQSVK
jgi:ribose 1,5-bisphosphate isomerase